MELQKLLVYEQRQDEDKTDWLSVPVAVAEVEALAMVPVVSLRVILVSQESAADTVSFSGLWFGIRHNRQKPVPGKDPAESPESGCRSAASSFSSTRNEKDGNKCC